MIGNDDSNSIATCYPPLFHKTSEHGDYFHCQEYEWTSFCVPKSLNFQISNLTNLCLYYQSVYCLLTNGSPNFPDIVWQEISQRLCLYNTHTRQSTDHITTMFKLHVDTLVIVCLLDRWEPLPHYFTFIMTIMMMKVKVNLRDKKKIHTI